MYAIEINLLKERSRYQQAVSTRSQIFSPSDRVLLFVGVAVGGSFLGLVLAALLVLNLLNQKLTVREQEIDEKLAQLAPQLKEVEDLRAEEQRLQAETKALASIFNQVKPWSATLQDIRDRVPMGLQITGIQQGAGEETSGSSSSTAASSSSSASPSPSASPSSSSSASSGSTAATPPAQPTGDLTIKGNALSFGDINDFVLALQDSAFIKGDATRLIQAQRQDSSQTSNQTTNTPNGPSLVEYRIQSGLSEVPASDLLQELNRKGAAGLVTRIQTLRERGVLQR